eukprot:1168864-Amorphochlora_amoeboformis.AAC.1
MYPGIAATTFRTAFRAIESTDISVSVEELGGILLYLDVLLGSKGDGSGLLSIYVFDLASSQDEFALGELGLAHPTLLPQTTLAQLGNRLQVHANRPSVRFVSPRAADFRGALDSDGITEPRFFFFIG